MVLLRAVPAVALLFGSLFYAFPRAAKLAKKAGSVMYTDGGSALTVVGKLAELPDWAWAAMVLVLTIIYLAHVTFGLDRVWRWLMLVDENEDDARRRRDGEAVALRAAAPAAACVKLEPAGGAAGAGGAGASEGARAWGQAVAELGAARSASAPDGPHWRAARYLGAAWEARG